MTKFLTTCLLLCSMSLSAQETRVIGLLDAQDYASENNQMLKAGLAQVEQAKAKKFQSWAGHLPQVTLKESGMRTNDAVNAFGIRLRQERFTQNDFDVAALNSPTAITNFQTQLEIRQPLLNGGQAIYGRKAASAMVAGASAEYTRHEQVVRFETAKAYWGAVLAQEALGAVRLGLETARKHAQNTELRYREQATDFADVLAARVRVAELEGEEIRASNAVAAAHDDLALVMGIGFDVKLTLADSLTRPALALQLDNLLHLAQEQRPDLQAARYQARAAENQVGVARADMLPKLNAFATLSLDSQDMFKRAGESWVVGGQVTWALFSGGQTIGKVREAKAGRTGARALVEFKQADAEREVRAAYREVMAANSQVDIAQRGVGHAEERLRITQLQYREGLATSLDLLTAESELRRARVQLFRALYGLNMGLAELELTVGQQIAGL